MTDETLISQYKCSACGAELTSEGTEALDHMAAEHDVDPEAGPQATSPYLIPVE